MSDVEIKGKISVDTGTSTKSINEMNQAIKDAKKALNEAKVGSQEYTEAQKKLTDAQKEMEQSTNKGGGAFDVLKNKIQNTVPALKGAEEGGKGFLNTLRALAANPIILILTALVAILEVVYKAFANTFEGGEKIEQVFAGIKAAGQALLDSLSKIGDAIYKVFTFDFSGALDDIKEVGNAAADAYNKMADLTKQSQQLARDQATNDLEQAEREKRLAILREQAGDDTIPIAKRKAALQDLKKDSEQNAKDDIELARKVAENKIAQLTLEKDGDKKNFIEIQKIKADQIRVETQNANELRRIDKQITSTERQEIQEREQAAKEAAAKQKERNAKKLEDAKELARKLTEAEKIEDAAREKTGADDRAFQLNKLKKQFDQDALILAQQGVSNLKLREAYLKQVQALEEKYAKQDAEEKKAADAAEIQNQKDKLGKLSITKLEYANADIQISKLSEEQKKQINESEIQGLNAIGDIIGKQTAVGKGLAIATATINTFQGATEALKQKSTLPSPWDVVAKVANVAAVIATGFKSIKAITAVNVPGGGGSGGSPSAPTISAPILPTQTSTSLDSASIQGVGNAAAAGAGRVFVLDSDVQDSAERNAKINRAARLG